jgi:hypothetical protein
MEPLSIGGCVVEVEPDCENCVVEGVAGKGVGGV